MTDTTTTTNESPVAETVIPGTAETWAHAEAGVTLGFTYGGRKRKGDKPAFAKFERGVTWNSLPDESKLFLVRYGIMQYTADGMNTADSDADAQAAVDGRIAKLVAADFTRERGEPGVTDDPEVLANQLAREELSAVIKAQGVTLTKEQRAAAVTAYRTANADRLVKEAGDRIAARKAKAGTFDLSAFLTPAAPTPAAS